MKLAEVHTLYETNRRSIPDMLRQFADGIETEVDEGYSPDVAQSRFTGMATATI